MKEALGRLKARFDALNRRERAFVTIAAWLAVLFLLEAVAVTPVRQRNAALAKAVVEKQGEVARFEAERAGLHSRLAQDPDAQAKRRIAELEGRIAAIDSQLETVGTRIVPPEKMAGLLDQMLRRNKRLELVSLRSLPPETLLKEEPSAAAGSAGPEKSQAGLLYRQGMELALGGSYLDMLDYLAQVEQLPWKIYWGRLELKVENYPRAILRLQVYTLSMDKAWLSI